MQAFLFCGRLIIAPTGAWERCADVDDCGMRYDIVSDSGTKKSGRNGIRSLFFFPAEMLVVNLFQIGPVLLVQLGQHIGK